MNKNLIEFNSIHIPILIEFPIHCLRGIGTANVVELKLT